MSPISNNVITHKILGMLANLLGDPSLHAFNTFQRLLKNLSKRVFDENVFSHARHADAPG